MKNQIINRFKLVFFLMLVVGNLNLNAQTSSPAEIRLEHDVLGKAPTIDV